MPIFDWECEKCGERAINQYTASHKDPAPTCPKCKAVMIKLFLKCSVLFQGLSTPGRGTYIKTREGK